MANRSIDEDARKSEEKKPIILIDLTDEDPPVSILFPNRDPTEDQLKVRLITSKVIFVDLTDEDPPDSSSSGHDAESKRVIEVIDLTNEDSPPDATGARPSAESTKTNDHATEATGRETSPPPLLPQDPQDGTPQKTPPPEEEV